MHLQEEDLIGKTDKIEIFNNIGHWYEEENTSDAHIINLEGRLTVQLEVSPTPRIYWEFEKARGTDNLSPRPSSNIQLTSWDGAESQLIIKNPRPNSWISGRQVVSGYAKSVEYGDPDHQAHYFKFYLPNTDFIRVALKQGLNIIRNQMPNSEFWAQIRDGWNLSLNTTQDAIDWLDPQSQNRGSMITLSIGLFQDAQRNRQITTQSISELQTLSLREAKKIVDKLCLLLSYANGGSVAPIYSSAVQFFADEGDVNLQTVASICEVYPVIKPQEEIGISFLADYGIKDVLTLIENFTRFETMHQTSHWQKKWGLILEWYFQAIPKAGGRQKNKHPSILANVLGTLLENVCQLILVKDQLISNGKYQDLGAVKRIRELQKEMGIIPSQDIELFNKIRTNSTHAKQKTIERDGIKLSGLQEYEVIQQAIQWVEEMILWRLGYSGAHRSRSLREETTITPRYSFEKRKAKWDE
ncbi:hypothetical protein Lepto7376_1753 [[Leptolyngbya] sp. PCC 7376]|uniref:hypothetical protein n=1 Tax=[Leptolyngbya] sp. PCC 7376 TaxID=111781 RepID=UPI00029ED58E|nr:hypothetical protein [[Leptolyngbya] sp. PCC 7376]AFY38086.1 hypothetical protein Lepto7376_1753 [[Leptolyngbya] sp. PCC 7376]